MTEKKGRSTLPLFGALPLPLPVTPLDGSMCFSSSFGVEDKPQAKQGNAVSKG